MARLSGLDRGQVTFTIKSLVLILSIIVFMVIVWRYQNFFMGTVEEKQRFDFRIEVLNTLQKLINDEECLAYSFENVTKKGVISKKKLGKFENKYDSLEPDCAPSTTFDYNVEVKTIDTRFSIYQGSSSRIFRELVSLIDGKKVVFVNDWSASMHKKAVPHESMSKIECVGVFLGKFVEGLSGRSVITINTFPKPKSFGSGRCGIKENFIGTSRLASADRENLKQRIEKHAKKSQTHCCTPMAEGLKSAFEFARSHEVEVIVLLGDGKQCCGTCLPKGSTVEVANNNKDLGIPVHAIAFGLGPDTETLSKTSDITGGRYFRAETCRELIREPKKLMDKRIPFQRWSFGVGKSKSEYNGEDVTKFKQFSSGEAKEDELVITLPVSIRYSPNNYKRAIISIRAVKGKLERFSGYINKVCRLGQKKNEDTEVSFKMSFKNPLRLKDGKEPKLCMYGPQKTCKILSCNLDIDFENIEREGDYLIKVKYIRKNNKLKVET